MGLLETTEVLRHPGLPLEWFSGRVPNYKGKWGLGKEEAAAWTGDSASVGRAEELSGALRCARPSAPPAKEPHRTDTCPSVHGKLVGSRGTRATDRTTAIARSAETKRKVKQHTSCTMRVFLVFSPPCPSRGRSCSWRRKGVVVKELSPLSTPGCLHAGHFSLKTNGDLREVKAVCWLLDYCMFAVLFQTILDFQHDYLTGCGICPGVTKGKKEPFDGMRLTWVIGKEILFRFELRLLGKPLGLVSLL